MAEFLKDAQTDFNVSSPFLRCRQTVEIIEEITENEFVFNPLLHDIIHSEESVKDVAKRITKFYEELTSHNYKAVAICSHGFPIAMLKSLATEGNVDMSKLMDYPTPGILVTIRDKKVSFKDFN